MILKKINIWMAFMAMAIFACEPLEDVYDELDEDKTEGVVTDLTITLSEDDYELALPYAENASDSSSLSSYYNLTDEQARKYIPFILSEKFPQLGSGASVSVTYDQYQGSASGVSTYTSATNYVFDADDYSYVNADAGVAGFFNNTYPAENYISDILESNVQDPAEGDLIAVTYKYADKEYQDIEYESVYSETFDADLGSDFTTASVAGTAEWHWGSYSGDGYAYMSAYQNGANEDWLISPEYDLTGVEGATLRVYQAINYIGDLEMGSDLAVMISEDFSGDVSTATWTNLELDTWPSGTGWTFVESHVDLSDYEGSTFHIAFYYTSTEDTAPAWEVSTVAIEVGESIETTTYNVFYEYLESESSWKEVEEGVYYLSSADYDAMGAPGQYDNFSSSLPADDYIVTFLNVNHPYAQEEDQIIVVYKYYSSSAGATQTRGNLYTVADGAWTAYSTVAEATLLFALSGSTWEPDNTIKVTLGSADYSWIAEEFASVNPSGASNMASYGNFSCYAWSDEQIFASITGRLEAIYGTPEDGQKYQVTYSLYCGATSAPVLAVIYENGEWAEQ